MSQFVVPPVSQAGFALSTSVEGGTVTVRLSGNADMSAQMALSVALRQVHSEALRIGVSEVVCDFGDLYFMSSSCFKAFVTWVTNLIAVSPNKQYRLRVRSNRQLAWQRRSVEALRCLADKVVIVES
jgi:hypothetical protein